MRVNDELFEIVAALSPAEKRYFKLNARRYAQGKSNYEKLFDALCKYSTLPYNEKAFIKQHKGKSFVKNLAYEKIYLRDLLLKTMRNFRSGKNGQATIQELITDLEFMVERGLTDGALRLLDAAWEKANEMELYPEMLTVLHFRRRLLWHGARVEQFDYKKHIDEERAVLQQLQTLQQCTHLLMRVEDINSLGNWQHQTAEVDEILVAIKAIELELNPGLRARYNLLSAKTLILFKRTQFKAAYNYLQEYLSQLEENSNLHFLRSRTYYGVLSNFLYTAMMLEDYSQFPTTLKKIKLLEPLNEQERLDLFLIKTRYEAIYMLNTGIFVEAKKLQEETLSGLDFFKNNMRKADQLASVFNLILISFFTKNPDQAITNINRLFSIAGNDKKQAELLIIARFIELMCHSDIGNLDLVISYQRNLLRQIKLYAPQTDYLRRLAHIVLLKACNNLDRSEFNWLMQLQEDQLPPQWAQVPGLIRHWCT